MTSRYEHHWSVSNVAAALMRAASTLVFLAGALLAGPALSADDTPLQGRAKAVLAAYPEARTKEARAEIAEELLAMADTLESAGEDVLASECFERAGIVSYRQADYTTASERWERGLAAARRSGDKKRIAALLNARAVGVSITGDDETAIVLQTELIGLRRELDDVRGEGISWHNLAFSYFALFRYPEAIDALTNALHLHREADNAYALAGSMGTLANALFEVGRYTDAMAMGDSAVTRARKVGDPSLLGPGLHGRARQLHYAGRYDEALADYREAHDVLARAGDVRVAANNDLNWANALISLERCDEARRIVDAAMVDVTEIGDASLQVWGDCVSARITARCGSADEARSALLATIDELEAIRDSIPDDVSRADAFRVAGGAYTDLALLEAAGGDPEAAWWAIESGTARVFRESLSIGDEFTPAVILPRLQRQLSEMGAVALQYGHATVDRMAVCAITPSAVRVVHIPIEPGFRLDMSNALELMSSGASDPECRPILARLARAVLDPVTAELSGDARRIVVFPGSLAGFPMETLPIPGTNEVALGERFAVSYASSATAFLHLQEGAAGPGPVVVFADPDLGNEDDGGIIGQMRSARLQLQPLPEARAEGRAIGRAGDLLAGEDATKTAFLERARNAAVIHLATHAVTDATYPGHSGVVLAGAGGDMLTVGELQSVPLSADLVSLSGCATAGGYVATGDGAFGLTRAFLLAGARTVVSSWWDVEDAAARRFMELYYDALRKGEARDIALQRAHNTMAQEGYSLRNRFAFALVGATAEPVAALVDPVLPSEVTAGAIAAVVIVVVLVWNMRRRRNPRAHDA